MSVHYCEEYCMPAEAHDQEGTSWLLPPCCSECPCGSYEAYLAEGGEPIYEADPPNEEERTA